MFPIDVWLMIFMNIDFYDIQRMFRVSKCFYRIKNNNLFWENYYKKRFGSGICGEFGYYPMVMNKVSNRWNCAIKICAILYDNQEDYFNTNTNNDIGCFHPECIFSHEIHKAIKTPNIIVFGGFVRDYVCTSSYFRNTSVYPIKREFDDIDIIINDADNWENILEDIHEKLKNHDINLSVVNITDEKYDNKTIKFVARDTITNTKIKLDVSIGYLSPLVDFDVNSLYFKKFKYSCKPIIGTKIKLNGCLGQMIVNCQKGSANIEFTKKDLINLTKNDSNSIKIRKRIDKMINKGYVIQ